MLTIHRRSVTNILKNLFAVFIERCIRFIKVDGYTSLVTPQSWMFLVAFDKLREKILRGYNDLESKRPDLLEEWDYEKNITIQPYTITDKSGKKVWWKCKKGHSWIATAHDRSRGTGCPICKKMNRDDRSRNSAYHR